MKLEKIVLNGFKSFAEKTELSFDSPVTAVVGPNGCGKSNIVDAVKWVLGEQSVKSMRSGQMADVIFSGSSSRKPLATAEVCLVVENTGGKLPLEADHIQISRRIYKTGECEYRINNKICRLKDIKELFMDTGIGTKAYSIIEQGQISQLLNASKTDRRTIFEEAAGISRYKAHKNEAMRKLEKTEQNLLRLADIVAEVQKQLRSIKLQATKARNYLQLSEELKKVQLNHSLAEYHKINTHLLQRKTDLAQLEEQFAAVAAETARNDALLSRLQQKITETENHINQTDNQLVAIQSKIEQQLQKMDFLRSRVEETGQKKDTAEKKLDRIKQHGKLLDEELKQQNHRLEQCRNLTLQKKDAVEKIQKDIQSITSDCSRLEVELEDEKSGIIDIVRMTAQLHNEVQGICVYRSSLASQKDRLAGKADTAKAELEKLLTEKARLAVRLKDIENVLEQLKHNLELKTEQARQISISSESDIKILALKKEAKSAIAGELSLLTDMEEKHEGLNDAIKNILNCRIEKTGRFDFVEAMLADIITTQPQYSNAVEAALEGKTDSLIVSDSAKLLAEKENINSLNGRVNFICLDKLEPFEDKTDISKLPLAKGRLAEFVTYRQNYAPLVWKLLGKTIVTDSIEAAAEYAQTLGSQYSFVTLNGEFAGPDGTIKLGPAGKTTTALISRKSRLQQLKQQGEVISEEIKKLEENSEKNRTETEHLTKLCKDLRTAVYEANTESLQLNSKIGAIEQNIERIRQEEPLMAGEMDLLENQIAQYVRKEYDSKQKLDELEAVNSERTAHIEKLQQEYNQKKSQQKELLEHLTDLKVALGQLTEQTESLEQIIKERKNQLLENQNTIQTTAAEIQNDNILITETQTGILNCEQIVSALFLEKENSQKTCHALHEEIEVLLEQKKQAEQIMRRNNDEKTRIDHNINQIKIELGQLDVKGQDLAERVQQEMGIDIAREYQNYTEEKIDWETIKERITELKQKIERLGNINVEAIEQQDSLEKRQQFLTSQLEDLNQSKAQLQQLISRLNKKSRQAFAETFELIRDHFQKIFRKLFGGGKADILLEDAEDILEAGIEITARPPGKETRSISLLSGGEKTMTAIALLFAVFKAKPSPFCMLDEVDAALDEANNERFNMLIKEFQQQSQFIIITHAKRTMSIADVLYGITMQSPGVSKKISVSFDQYEPQQQTTAVA